LTGKKMIRWVKEKVDRGLMYELRSAKAEKKFLE